MRADVSLHRKFSAAGADFLHHGHTTLSAPFTNFNDPEFTVTYDLESVDGGVQFTLTVDNLPLDTKSAKQMVQGGKMIVNTLRAVIETGRPALGIRLLYSLFKLMQPFSPKKCLSENWPVNGTNENPE